MKAKGNRTPPNARRALDVSAAEWLERTFDRVFVPPLRAAASPARTRPPLFATNETFNGETMSQFFETYCQQLRNQAAQLADQEETPIRMNHLHAFNFGRSVARMEYARHAFWLRLRWLLLGAATGILLGAACVQSVLGTHFIPLYK
jgi:hypothetical protein